MAIHETKQDFLPLNTTDTTGSGLPSFFLGKPAADSTATRNMTVKSTTRFHSMHFHNDVSLYVRLWAQCSASILLSLLKGVDFTDTMWQTAYLFKFYLYLQKWCANIGFKLWNSFWYNKEYCLHAFPNTRKIIISVILKFERWDTSAT